MDISIRHNRLKRLFDILFSVFFLVAGAPILLLIATLVALTSKGPIVYQSLRLGQGGKVISCLKFRTMYQNAHERLEELLQSDSEKRAEWDLYQKLKSDPRITSFGKFLRRTSLDESLQFWNVLKGELSVVGPRPVTLMGPPEQFLEEIQSIYGNEAKMILSVRPGITGVWQVSGRSEIALSKRKEMDLSYALNHTFWNDLGLICKTIPAVLFSRGVF